MESISYSLTRQPTQSVRTAATFALLLYTWYIDSFSTVSRILFARHAHIVHVAVFFFTPHRCTCTPFLTLRVDCEAPLYWSRRILPESRLKYVRARIRNEKSGRRKKSHVLQGRGTTGAILYAWYGVHHECCTVACVMRRRGPGRSR